MSSTNSLDPDLASEIVKVPTDSFDWISLALGIVGLCIAIGALILNFYFNRNPIPGPTGPTGPDNGPTGDTGPTGPIGPSGSSIGGSGFINWQVQNDIAPDTNQTIILGGTDYPLADSFYHLSASGGTIELTYDANFTPGTMLVFNAADRGDETTILSLIYLENSSENIFLNYTLRPDYCAVIIPVYDSNTIPKLLVLDFKAGNVDD